MSLKVLSESLERTPVKEKSYVVTTAREVNEKMLESYNKMKEIKESVEEVKSQWNALKEDIEGMSFARFVANGSLQEQFQNTLDTLKLQYEDAKTTYLHYKDLKNKMLTEAESIDKLDDDVEFEYDYAEDRPQELEEVPSDTSAVASETEDITIQDKLTELLDAGDVEDLLDFMFNEYVPEIGRSATKIGELTRALMNILYVYRLSNLTFYQDQGISECGGSAQYLMDNGYEKEILDIIHGDVSDYYDDVLAITKLIARDAISDPNSAVKTNTIDSQRYANDRIIANAPQFDYTVYFPYSVATAVEAGSITYTDVVDYIKDKSKLVDVESVDPFNDQSAVEFNNLNKEQFNALDSTFNNFTSAWKDLDVTTPAAQDTQTNVEIDDIVMMSDDDTLDEGIEATNIALNEETDDRLEQFLELHDDKNNFAANPDAFEYVYRIFDDYGFSAEDDVAVCFQQLSDDDKETVLTVLRRR